MTPSQDHVHRLRIRYSECDPQGVLFNGNYLHLYDVAMTELFRDRFGAWSSVLELGVDMVVGEIQLRFMAPIRADELVDITVHVVRWGRTSMTVDVRYAVGDRVAAEGTVRNVCIRSDFTGSAPIPDVIKRALGPDTNGDGAARFADQHAALDVR